MSTPQTKLNFSRAVSIDDDEARAAKPLNFSRAQSAPQPDIVSALQGLTDSTNKVTKRMMRQLPKAQPVQPSQPVPGIDPRTGNVPNLQNLVTEARESPDPTAQRNQGIREQVMNERHPTTFKGKVGRYAQQMQEDLNPIQVGYNALRPEADIVGEEVNKRIEAADRANTPEMVNARKKFGAIGSSTVPGLSDAVKSIVKATPLASYAEPIGAVADDALNARSLSSIPATLYSDALKGAGGVVDTATRAGEFTGITPLARAIGLHPEKIRDYLNATGNAFKEAQTLPPLSAKGEEIKRKIPEKIVSSLGEMGVGIGELMLLKKLSITKANPQGLSLAKIMAIETAAKTSDLPLKERGQRVAEATAMGRVLDGHLGRTASAVLFGLPTAIQSGTGYLQGQTSGEDALLQTGIQTAVGGIMGGKPKGVEGERQAETQRQGVQTEQSNTTAEKAVGGNVDRVDGPELSNVVSPSVDTPLNFTRAVEVPEHHSGSAQPSRGNAASSKGFVNRATGQSEVDFSAANSPAFRDHGLRGLDVPSQRKVMDGVLTALHDPQVRDEVVKFVPVDVVDDFLSGKLTTEMLLRDPAMLKDSPSVGKADHPIPLSVDTASALVRVTADVVAKRGLVLSQPARPSLTSVSAMGTGNRSSISVADGGASATSTEAKPHFSNFQNRRARNTEYGTKGRFKAGKVAEPETVNENQTSSSQPLETKPEAASPERALIDRYEEGDSKIVTANDLVNELDAVTENPKVQAAIDKFRREQEYDNELKGRGDMNSAEEALLAEVRAATEQASSVAIEKELSPEIRGVFDELLGKESKAGVSTAPAESSTTSAKHESMRTDRKAFGMPEVPTKIVKDVDVFARAKEANAADPTAPVRIADKVLNDKHNLSDQETHQIILRAQELKNQHRELLDQIANSTDDAEIQSKGADADALLREYEKLSAASDTSGSEQARAFRARRHAVNDRYELLPMLAEAKKVRGRNLTPPEHERISGMAKEIESLTTKLADAEERAKSNQLQKEIDRVIRRGRRSEVKQTLDDEFASLKTLFVQAKKEVPLVQASGLASLDPEGTLTKLIAKMAHNRVKSGVNTAEGLVDEIFNAVKDHVEGITKRDVRDAISGYGLEPKGDKRAPEVKQLADIRSQLKKLSSQEDIESGKKLSPRDKARQTQLLKQETELQRRLSQGDFSPKPKKETPVYSRETIKISDRIQKLKSEYDAELERQSPWHWLKNLSGIRKSGMLSWYVTHVRNILGTGAHVGFEEARRIPSVIADAIMSTASGQRTATLSPSAMLDGAVQAWKVGGREAREILKHGATKEQLEKQQLQEINTGVKAIDMAFNSVFRVMSASDRVFYQGSYKRNLVERAQAQAKTEGRTDKTLDWRSRAKELTENPTMEMEADAKHDALVATFNNNNRLSDAIKRGRGALGAGGNFALDLVLPFDRTPTNVLARVIEASPIGYGKNAGQIAKALWTRKFSPAQQRSIQETFGRATTGSAVMTLGFALAAKGLLTTDDYGNTFLEVRGHKVNLSSIAPLGTLLGVGAGLQKQYAKGDATKRNYAGAIGKPLADQPLLRASSQVSDMIKDPNRSARKFAADTAFSFVPFSGAVRGIARATDSEDKRFPNRNSIKEQFQQNIPEWRKSLNISPSPLFTGQSSSSGATKEIARLGMAIRGPQPSPDESAEEFEQRRVKVSPVMRNALEALVSDPEYQSLNDKEKKEAIKTVMKDVTDDYRKQRDRQKPRERERRRPRSRPSYAFN